MQRRRHDRRRLDCATILLIRAFKVFFFAYSLLSGGHIKGEERQPIVGGAYAQSIRRGDPLKKTLVLGVLAALLPAVGVAAQSTPAPARAALPRTVVVSLNRVLNESAEGRAVGQRMQALLQKMTVDLAGKQKEPDFQRLAQQSQAEYANAQRQAQTDLRAKMNPVIAAIAAERGVDVILNADTLVWSAPKLDVTNEVISKMDAAAASPAPGK